MWRLKHFLEIFCEKTFLQKSNLREVLNEAKTQPTQEEFRHHRIDFFKMRFKVAQNNPETLLK